MAALVICISVLAGRARNLPLIITVITAKTGRYKQAFYLYGGREEKDSQDKRKKDSRSTVRYKAIYTYIILSPAYAPVNWLVR